MAQVGGSMLKSSHWRHYPCFLWLPDWVQTVVVLIPSNRSLVWVAVGIVYFKYSNIRFADDLALWRRCLPGERWIENCSSCHCDSKGLIKCDKKVLPCDEDCSHNGIWYDKTKRCYCTGPRGHTVCAELGFQKALSNQPCPVENAYFFSDCIYCACTKNKTTACASTSCGKFLGICTPGVMSMQMCFQCFCTHTLFQICIPNDNCLKAKAGLCPEVNILNLSTYLWCSFGMHHKCYHDGDCNGDKKCCLVYNCYYICIDPLPE
ncbi:uncharacterized protein [Periplaneta americana]|uniref:uncharacterized protein n=1 Tax=Periplaneta americana TaxID=6978 RepID=UPI0037E81854